jgi:hypothetical protein
LSAPAVLMKKQCAEQETKSFVKKGRVTDNLDRDLKTIDEVFELPRVSEIVDIIVKENNFYS